MDTLVLVVFALVYLGMILGGLPGLKLDRTGVALLGAIALIAAGRVTPHDAWNAIDVATIALLFGLMVVSAQFETSGTYAVLTRKLASAAVSPPRLLLYLCLVAGGLSAVLTNDVVCLAMAPLLVEGCVRRSLDPKPFLFGLAASANVGSAATLIGNPQNILIGQKLDVDFAAYLVEGGVPAAVGLVATWGVIAFLWRGKWHARTPLGPVLSGAPGAPLSPLSPVAAEPFDRWQAAKAWSLSAALIVLFLFSELPREALALAAAGIVLLSRTRATTRFLGFVDWELLVLFMGLFVVNHALERSGASAHGLDWLVAHGVDLHEPATLFVVIVLASNVISNVPAIMLVLPAATHPDAGPVLAVASTLAGNLLVVGSIANLIVIDQAARLGVRITWREHAKVGVPVTLVTLALAALWFWLRA
ncbi:MAG: anion transporter [Planctomycetes bacterium]|nr:anion transporter [Planctomycetota bacterium]